jgi:hypothetical protein
MANSANTHVRQALASVLRQEAGQDADSSAVVAAASRLFDRLTRELTPLVGAGGADAITTRSLHLARREFPWLPELSASGDSDGLSAGSELRLERHDAAAVADATVAALAALVALLVGLIGQGLTSGLVQAAWSMQLPRGEEPEGSER